MPGTPSLREAVKPEEKQPVAWCLGAATAFCRIKGQAEPVGKTGPFRARVIGAPVASQAQLPCEALGVGLQRSGTPLSSPPPPPPPSCFHLLHGFRRWGG